MIRVVVAPELRLFLRGAARRHGFLDVAHDPTATLGHVVQAAGIPLTEVDRLDVAGRRTQADERLADDVEVHVAARARPQPLGGPPHFLLDVHLGTLARRLRLLGLDVAYCNDADDDELVHRANDENRVLLTQDRGLLMRRALQRGAFVRGSDPDEQLADVLDRFRPPLAPYSRCTACGGAVHPVPKADVEKHLQPGTRRTQQTFTRCDECGQVYWPGAHSGRLNELVRKATVWS